MSRARLYRTHRKYAWGVEASPTPTQYVPRTESEEARRAARDWLRDRSDEDVPEFEVEDNWDAI